MKNLIPFLILLMLSSCGDGDIIAQYEEVEDRFEKAGDIINKKDNPKNTSRVKKL